ncbi:30S ribosomal protein S6 [Candidatus Saccharibacteria bacterium]|nr:30S ribosomal protein S6 [Candidatus Saccharibacteria bacterium]MCL1963327.1 30S ribosomal protein S6 [Candidatus Saccharibacteria bacterium]
MPEKTNINEYELVVMFRPELEAKMDAPLAVVAKLIADNGGKITAEDDWGRRELAYKIAGETHAIYRVYTLELPSSAPAKVDGVLNITDGVIRHLLTRVDPKVKAVLAEEAERRAARKEAEEEEKSEKTEDEE